MFVALGWACGYAEGQDETDRIPMWTSLIQAAALDSMGRSSSIVYFPEWTLADRVPQTSTSS